MLEFSGVSVWGNGCDWLCRWSQSDVSTHRHLLLEQIVGLHCTSSPNCYFWIYFSLSHWGTKTHHRNFFLIRLIWPQDGNVSWRRERTKHDFRCPICRSAIDQASCLICARRCQLTFSFCCYISLLTDICRRFFHLRDVEEAEWVTVQEADTMFLDDAMRPSSSISVAALLKIIKISRKLLTIAHPANPMLGPRIPPSERLWLLRGCCSLHLFYCHICLPYLAWATICCWWIRQHPT